MGGKAQGFSLLNASCCGALWTKDYKLSGVGVGAGRMRDSATAECLKNHRATDAEAEDRAEGGDIDEGVSDVEIVGDERDGGKSDSEDVQPERRLDIGEVAAKSYLQEQGSETYGSDNNESKRAKEGTTTSEDNDEREGKNEKAGSNDGPTTSHLARAGIGQWAISAVASITLL
jgi:hypothetical protein